VIVPLFIITGLHCAREGLPGYEDASYMDIALFMAKVIHADLVYANAASWYFWTAMDMERWCHKNRKW
jgi:hypothetical protein